MFCLEAAAGHCSGAVVERGVVADGLVGVVKIILDVFPRILAWL